MFVGSLALPIVPVVAHFQHKLRKTFSKFYRFQPISKFNVGLKTLLRESLSEPEFYGDLVYKFKKLIGRNDFSFQFRKNHYALQT